MSRVRALWISAIFTVAVILVVGAIFMRPVLGESAGSQTSSTTTLVTGERGQPATSAEAANLIYSDAQGNEHESQHQSDHDDDHQKDHDDDD